MKNFPTGEFAGVFASLAWTIGSIIFATIARKMNVFRLNALRNVLALGFIFFAHLAIYGVPLPSANPEQWFYMSLSSLIGLVIGDFTYFLCLVYLGARRGVLLISMAPIFTIISAFLILGETLTFGNYLGIAITMSGVWLVLSESEYNTGEKPLSRKEKTLGILFGLFAAAGQGVGLVVSKHGMLGVIEEGGKALETLPATLIRLIFASVFMWVFIVARGGDTGKLIDSVKRNRSLKMILIATFIGSFLGLWLSMIAVTYTKAGIASTLLSLMPVMVIPILYFTDKQRTSLRSIIGATITVAGVAILFMI